MNSIKYTNDDGYLAVGAKDEGGEILRIFENGTVHDLSSPVVQDTHEILAVCMAQNRVLIGGWGLNKSYVAQLFPENNTVQTISMAGSDWNLKGSETLALSSGTNTTLVGGGVSTQYKNSSGCLLGTLRTNLQASDATSLFEKTYVEKVLSKPPKPAFYFYASPNYVTPGTGFTLIGNNLAANTLDQLIFNNQNYYIQTTAFGNFSYYISVPAQTPPGDYLLSLYDQGHVYYNYLVVLYKYTQLNFGAIMPNNDAMGYPLLDSGGAVREGNYIEFVRFLRGDVPVNSANYLVQWTTIEYDELNTGGFYVGGGVVGYSAEYNLEAFVSGYTGWVQQFGKFEKNGTGIPMGQVNSYLYVNGNMMILWVPISAISESNFIWEFDTDYVQGSPYYTPAFRMESGQTFLSVYNGSITPSTVSEPNPTPSPSQPPISPTASPGPTSTPTQTLAPSGTPTPTPTPTATPSYPYVDLTPVINGSTLYLNGVALPRTSGATITQIKFSWGDGSIDITWFAQTHTYSYGGTYNVTVSATDSNGLVGAKSVMVVIQGSTPPPTQTPNPTATPSPVPTPPPVIPEFSHWLTTFLAALVTAALLEIKSKAKKCKQVTLPVMA
jgi:hypothetical protein